MEYLPIDLMWDNAANPFNYMIKRPWERATRWAQPYQKDPFAPAKAAPQLPVFGGTKYMMGKNGQRVALPDIPWNKTFEQMDKYLTPSEKHAKVKIEADKKKRKGTDTKWKKIKRVKLEPGRNKKRFQRIKRSDYWIVRATRTKKVTGKSYYIK